MKKVFIIIFISVVIISCSAKSFAPTDDQLSAMQQKVPGISLDDAKAGYALYVQKCAGCHHLYRPEKYTSAQWDNILPKMLPKAKVSTGEERKLVQDYLHALAK